MPKLDGAEFVRQFRKLPLCFDVPVVVVTVYEDRDFRYQALEAGATDFLISPVDHHEFRTRVRNLLTLAPAAGDHPQARPDAGGEAGPHQPPAGRGGAGEPRDAEPCHRHRAGDDLRHRCRGPLRLRQRRPVRFLPHRRPRTPHGRPIAELFGEDYAHRHRELDAQVFATGRLQSGFEEIIADREGQPRVFLTTKAPLRKRSGEVINVVSVSLDITARKQAEHALARAKDEAEAANRSKTEFLASTSHELRTPLNAIIGFAEMMKIELLGPIGNPRYHDYAADILASAQHLLQIIDDLLDMSASRRASSSSTKPSSPCRRC